MSNLSKLLFLTTTFVTLSASGMEGAFEDLLQQLSEIDPTTKFAAAQELAQMEKQNSGILGEYAPAVQRALVDGYYVQLSEANPATKFAAAEELARLELRYPGTLGGYTQRVLQILMDSLGGADLERRHAAAYTLRELNDQSPGTLSEEDFQKVLPILVDAYLLHLDGEQSVQRAAAGELAYLEQQKPGILGENLQRIQQILAAHQ
ncbi:MAG: hypothetical protein LBJ70_04465 [Holosporales bacterium]|nr:hypothetical protein [Holosporales bacterium]